MSSVPVPLVQPAFSRAFRRPHQRLLPIQRDALSVVDGFPAKRVDVIYNGVDTAQFAQQNSDTAARNDLRRQLGLAAGRKYISMIARFHPVKDHESLLRAFHLVCQKRDDTDLLLVGDGELRQEMELLAAELNIEDRVHFWGVRNDVAKILQAIDVFTLTSVSEAASLTLLEAMACSCPVVVTNVGGNPEIIDDGKSGLLVPRQDSQAMADAFLQLLSDPDKARAFGEAARRTVLERFQLSQAVEQYGSLYEELVA